MLIDAQNGWMHWQHPIMRLLEVPKKKTIYKIQHYQQRSAGEAVFREI